MTDTWSIVEVGNRIVVPFAWRSDDLGRAEFQVCIKFLRGKMSDFWVYPRQQVLDVYTAWHCATSYQDFHIGSYQHLDDAKVWLINYCKQHKATMLNIYVPDDSTYLEIEHRGITFWRTKPPY